MEFDKIKTAVANFFDRNEKLAIQQRMVDQTFQKSRSSEEKLELDQCLYAEKNIPIIKARLDELIKNINTSVFDNKGSVIPWKVTIGKSPRSHNEGGNSIYEYGEGYGIVGGHDVFDGWFLTREQDTELKVGSLFQLQIKLIFPLTETNTAGQINRHSNKYFSIFGFMSGDLFHNHESGTFYRSYSSLSIHRNFYLDNPNELVAEFGNKLKEELLGLNDFQNHSPKN
jgi:hypothetical protein